MSQYQHDVDFGACEVAAAGICLLDFLLISYLTLIVPQLHNYSAADDSLSGTDVLLSGWYWTPITLSWSPFVYSLQVL